MFVSYASRDFIASWGWKTTITTRTSQQTRKKKQKKQRLVNYPKGPIEHPKGRSRTPQ